MNLRILFACLGCLTAHAPVALADDDGESAEGSDASTSEADSESSEEDASESYTSEVPRWKAFGVGLGGRRGPMSGAGGWWGDLILAVRTSNGESLGVRIELDLSIGRLSHENDIPLNDATPARLAHNDETLNLYSGLLRVALEIPVHPLSLRLGPAVGAGMGSYESSVTSCGKDDWSRGMYGGGVDVAVGLGEPVFLEPFVRFDALRIENPECTQGPPRRDGSSEFEPPTQQYATDIGLYVGAGVVLAL